MRTDEQRLMDMLLSVRAVIEFTDGVTVEKFMAERLIQSAVIRELEIIGEASRHVSWETKNRHSQIAWKSIAGMRNILSHEYFDVRLDSVWDVVQNSIPVLYEQLKTIIPPDHLQMLE
jgi:uncharacterized protein with HEPN domain